MTIFSIVIEDVANNYRMPREKISSLRSKSVCDECCQLTYKKKKNFKKRLQQLFNDEKKYLEKWF